MPKELRSQIEHHLATFPDWHQDLVEMKKEWEEYKKDDRQVKRQALIILIGFVATFVGVGVWVGTIQTNIENIVTDHIGTNRKTEQMEIRIGVLEVNNGEIRSRLASIEVTLQEIKAAITKLQ